MISGLFNIHTYSHLAEHKYLSYSIYKELQILDQLIRDNSRLDPEGIYDLMKAWSSLTIASILRDMEGNPSFSRDPIKDWPRRSGQDIGQYVQTRVQP